MNKSTLSTAIIMLGLGIGIGAFLSDQKNVITETEGGLSPVVSPKNNNENPLFYRNSMNPSVTSPVPAKDSMGMDYVAVYAEDNKEEAVLGTVKIDPVMVQNIGVRTAFAKRESMSRTIRAAGRVDFDEQKMARLHPKVEGWIEELKVDKTGETVKKGDVLGKLEIYYNNELIKSKEIVSNTDAKKVNFMKRFLKAGKKVQ